MNLPRARVDNVVVQNYESEVLVYDLTTHKAFCLNNTSAVVYHACDGSTTVEQLKARTKFDDDLIFLALSQLKDGKLVDDVALPQSFAQLSRREAIRKVGMASMIALPVITALVAPHAIHAASCRPSGGSCVINADCCSNVCIPDPNHNGRDKCA